MSRSQLCLPYSNICAPRGDRISSLIHSISFVSHQITILSSRIDNSTRFHLMRHEQSFKYLSFWKRKLNAVRDETSFKAVESDNEFERCERSLHGNLQSRHAISKGDADVAPISFDTIRGIPIFFPTKNIKE